MSWLSSSFKSLLGMNKKDKKPVEIKSPYDTDEMKQYQKSLQERLMGRGLSPEILDRTVSPFAASLRDKFTKYTTPAIRSAASAAGLSRSTIVPAQIGQKSLETEQTIDERLADIMYKNEYFKLQDKLAAEKELAGVGEGKTNIENQRLAENARASAAGRKAASEGLLRGVSTIGGTIVGGMTGGSQGAIAGGLAGFQSTSGQEADTGISWITDLINQRKAGTVSTGVNTNIYSRITAPRVSRVTSSGIQRPTQIYK